MLKRLTKKQEDLIVQVRTEWLDRIFKNPVSNDKAIREGIEWLYKFCKLKKPVIVILESPYAVQLSYNMLKNVNLFRKSNQVWDQVMDQVGNQVRDQVWNQVWDQVGNQVWDQVWDQVMDQVGNQVGNQVRDQVGNQVRDQVGNQVWDQVGVQVWNQVRNQVRDQVGDQVGVQVRDQVMDQVWAQVRDQKLEHIGFSSYGNIWDFGWLSFYDYFDRVITINNKGFESFMNLIKSGVYDMVQLDSLCLVSKLPSKIIRDEIKLHNDKGYAIEWKDGYGQHYLYGIYFSEALFKKVTSDKFTFKDAVNLENMEQRMAAMKLIGAEKLLESVNAKLLDKSTRGNELYEVEDIFEQTAYFLKYVCPSTKRVYVSGIDPNVGKEGKADKAMAWKYQLTIEEYNNLEVEA